MANDIAPEWANAAREACSKIAYFIDLYGGDLDRDLTAARVTVLSFIDDAEAAVTRLVKETSDRAALARESAQTLIAEIGAPGPEFVNVTAWRAVHVIRELRAEVERLEHERDTYRASVADLIAFREYGERFELAADRAVELLRDGPKPLAKEQP